VSPPAHDRPKSGLAGHPPTHLGERVANAPSPLLPDFDGPCLVNLVPALFTPAADRPSWFPAEVGDAGQVVLLVLDGSATSSSRSAGPSPHPLVGRPLPAHLGGASTTATALTSITTGCHRPSTHGRLPRPARRRGHESPALAARRARRPPAGPARSFQTQPPSGGARRRCGPVVARADFAATGSPPHTSRGWHTTRGTPPRPRGRGAQPPREGAPFVYAYYDGIDKVAHAKGLGAHYEAELAAVDQLSAIWLAPCPRVPRSSSPPTTARSTSDPPPRCSRPR